MGKFFTGGALLEAVKMLYMPQKNYLPNLSPFTELNIQDYAPIPEKLKKKQT